MTYDRTEKKKMCLAPFLPLMVFFITLWAASPAGAQAYPADQVYVVTTTDSSEIDTSTWQDVDGVQVAGLTGCGDSVSYAGQTYSTIIIGTQCWIGENLNVGTRVNGSVTMTVEQPVEKYCYADTESNCTAEGGLYQWDEAMGYVTTEGAQGICPPGWHIPTDAQWYTLESYLATGTCSSTRNNSWDCDPAGTKLKSGGSSGFNGLLAGGRDPGGSFSSLGTNANFWSSFVSGSYAWARTLASGDATVRRYAYGRAYGFSVRCLKD